jgi:hypothetical protein
MTKVVVLPFCLACFLGFALLGVLFQHWLNVRLQPEISRFSSRREARTVLRRKRTIGVSAMFFLGVFAYALGAGLAVGFLAIWFEAFFRRLGPVSWFVLAIIQIAPGAALAIWWNLRWSRQALRQALNEQGQPTCMSCGYDLRGLTPAPSDSAPVCPECGCA